MASCIRGTLSVLFMGLRVSTVCVSFCRHACMRMYFFVLSEYFLASVVSLECAYVRTCHEGNSPHRLLNSDLCDGGDVEVGVV